MRNPNRLSEGHHALVTAGPCAPPCKCDGYEIGLSLVNVLENGSYGREPIWPFLSASTEEEALNLAKLLRVAGRGAMKKADQSIGFSAKERLIMAAKDVAKRLAYTDRTSNGSLCGPPVTP
jgi:hypothetical protein